MSVSKVSRFKRVKCRFLFVILAAVAVSVHSSGQPCDPAPAGLVDWWRAEGDATDSIGTNNGTLEGTASFAQGEVGQAFSFDGSSGYVSIPDAPSLDTFTNSITIECWIQSGKSTANSGWEGLVCKGNSSWRLMGTSQASTVYVAFDGANPLGLESTRNVNDEQWHHVAATYDGQTMALYVDGTLDVSQSATGPIIQTSDDLTIGNNEGQSGLFWNGLIDEVSLYNRALSSNEIAAIYNAGISGKCSGPMPPSITAEPTNETIIAGTTATFDVTAAGFPPLSFQWNFNGTNILNATNASLTLTDVQFSQAGNYAVVITNPYGSTNSTSAVLTVNPPPPCDPPPAGLVNWWRAEGDSTDSVGSDNGTMQGTATFAPGEVGQAFSFDGSSGYVLIPDSPSLDAFTTNITIELWMNSGQLTANSDYEGIVAKGNSSWQILGTAGDKTLTVALNGVGPNSALVGTRIVNDGQWHHVAVTYDGGTVSLYVDGTLDVSQPAIGAIAVTTDPLAIGNDTGAPAGHSYLFNGLIDEISLYNRALSSSEVASIYDAAVSGKCPGQVPPTITIQPASQQLAIGDTATFTVVAAGTQPLYYQWSFNGTNIPGATDPTLTFADVQSSQAGNYAVSITNLYGTTNTIMATLAVHSCDPPPAGIVDWWRAEGEATDSIGTNDGILEGTATFVSGEVGQAFSFDGSSGYVSIPDSPSLDSFTNSMTIECWIKSGKTNSNSGWEGLVCKGNSSWRLMGTSGATTVYAAFNGANPLGLESTRSVNDEQWHHIAATYDGSTMALYVDGTLDVSQPATGSIFQTSDGLTIGNNAGQAGLFWNGLIDEVSLYNRALSASEIATIYAAEFGGKCSGPTPPSITMQPANQTVISGNSGAFNVVAAGSPPLYYQWTLNTASIPGATNATLTLLNVQSNNAGVYNVVVSNSFGTVTSSNAVLTVSNAPPFIMTPPQGTNVYSGTTLKLSATAGGSLPLGYQWQLNNVPIAGATNPAYTKLNAQTNDAGNYAVVITNPFGSITSSPPAIVTITILPTYVADDFEPGVDQTQWSSFSGSVLATNYGGYVSPTHSLWFGGALSFHTNRTATTRLINTMPGGPLQFYIRLGSGTNTNWKTPVLPYNGVYFEYSTNFGSNWLQITQYTTLNPYTNWTFQNLIMPLGAKGPTTMFRWRQTINLVDSGSDNWAIDDVNIGLQPPQITTQPSNVVVIVGSNATFTVAAIGTIPLTYQWMFNGTNMTGATNTSLIISNAQLANAGNYAVQITNAVGSVVSTNGILTVVPYYYFVWNSIPSPRFVNTPFKVAIQAMLTNGVYTNFSGTVALTSTNGLPVVPPASGIFNQGLWNGSITIPQPVSNLVLQSADGIGQPGSANPINVVLLPSLSSGVSGSTFDIEWPTSPSGFVLETASRLNGPWVPVSGSPTKIGGEYLEQVSISATNTFYRLRFTGP